MAEMEALLVQLRGLGKFNVLLNFPTFAPPVPAKVNAPPAEGRYPAGRFAPYNPGNIGVALSVCTPPGPFTVMEPASRPLIVGTEPDPAIAALTMQLPIEALDPEEEPNAAPVTL